MGVPLWKSSLFPLIYRCKQDNGFDFDFDFDDDKDPNQDRRSCPGYGAEQPQLPSLHKGEDSNLVSALQVQANATLASLSKVESANEMLILQSSTK